MYVEVSYKSWEGSVNQTHLSGTPYPKLRKHTWIQATFLFTSPDRGETISTTNTDNTQYLIFTLTHFPIAEQNQNQHQKKKNYKKEKESKAKRIPRADQVHINPICTQNKDI
jgi:hypothetical protein